MPQGRILLVNMLGLRLPNFNFGDYMSFKNKILALVLALSMVISALCSCSIPVLEDTADDDAPTITYLAIEGKSSFELELGVTRVLIIEQDEAVLDRIEWSVRGDAVTVDERGLIIAVKVGVATVTAKYGALSDSVTVTVVPADSGDNSGGSGDNSGDSGNEDNIGGNGSSDGAGNPDGGNIKTPFALTESTP